MLGLLVNPAVGEVPSPLVEDVQTDEVILRAAQVGAAVGEVAQLVEVVPVGDGRQDLPFRPAKVLGGAGGAAQVVEGEPSALCRHRSVAAPLVRAGVEVAVFQVAHAVFDVDHF